jgi:riboflavin kinase/FMN adenylyltransferase
LISDGNIREANGLLGRPYLVRGEVVRGDERGRKLGYPTANVLPDERQIVPGAGIYAGRVRVGGAWYGAATNVGFAPTFDRPDSRIEAYLLDFGGDLYGQTVDVTFVERLRPEEKFASVEELVGQMGRDVARAREVLRYS